MARPARLVLPGIPHHVTARGARREPTFYSDDDYARYAALLRHGCAKSGTAIWAWCRMPNHVHLLLVPDRPDGLAAAIGRAHRRYALEIDQRQGWCGAFWQGRFGSGALDERRLHICFR